MKNNMLTPIPTLISYMWNFGSLMMTMLFIQLITGILLSMHFKTSSEEAFESIIHMMNYSNYGWLIRLIHVNGASTYFLMIYMHIFKGMMFKSWKLKKTWLSGMTIYLMSMVTAFLGYILPWGQMSFWAATVITNLITTIPIIGEKIIITIWGGFAISSPTLNRFFTLHFTTPFLITLLVTIHLITLHKKGSSNPLGLSLSKDKLPFHPLFTTKDLTTASLLTSTLIMTSLTNPFLFMDPDNFTPANPMSTPEHIQPEWYFLFAYSILRAIPNKIGGVIIMMFSVLIFYFKPWMHTKKTFKYSTSNLLSMSLLSLLFLMLSLLGSYPAEYPYTMMMQAFTLAYFLMIMMS